MPRTPGGNALPSACCLNACSTASMHSSMPSSAATSRRLSNKVPFVVIHLLSLYWRKQFNEIRCRLDFNWPVSSTKDSRRRNSFQQDGALLDAEHRAFSQPNHWSIILFEELTNPLLLRFPHMG